MSETPFRYKQCIVLRADLGMSVGKLISATQPSRPPRRRRGGSPESGVDGGMRGLRRWFYGLNPSRS